MTFDPKIPTARLDKVMPSPPYYLMGQDLLCTDRNHEIFIKRIFSIKPKKRYGAVILAPGIATNGNLYRIDTDGNCLLLNHNRSFANLLAAEGFDVYIYHPRYTERVYNRYVTRYCKNSIFFDQVYKAPSELTFLELANAEIPQLIQFVVNHSGCEHISWIGYSLGGMLIYAYCMENDDPYIRNIITIGSPITFNQLFIRVIPYMNWASKALGLEEKSFLGTLSENLVPLTRMIRNLPEWLVRFNIIAPFLFNPFNINGATVKTLLGKIIEPIPSSLENCFSGFIEKGYPSEQNYAFHYLKSLRRLQKQDKQFLFFYGPYDVLAPPDSVFLAHEIISPDYPNLIKVPAAGHLDLIVGLNSRHYLWLPIVEWLKDFAVI
jgi:pimeloyl-ACP methyl ester carboxylesterase